MSSTEPRHSTRDADRTRAAILAAFGQMVASHGTQVSLAAVAAAAGVTKSGLMHHFPTRRHLVSQLILHSLERTWEEVQSLVDLSEGRPGQFTRAYIRAFTGDSPYLTELHGATGLVNRLGMESGLTTLLEVAPDDPQRWNDAFERDGLPEARMLVIRFAADGVIASLGTPFTTDEEVALVRAELLAMAEPV